MSDSNKKLCCFVSPYFGKLPLIMPALLRTAKENPGYNWLLYTDDHTEYSYPENVLVKYCTFDEMVERIQKCYDFKIAKVGKSNPYKLCDFRPAFGHIFADELQNFEFWGYCDWDEYYGDLSHFIPREFLLQYDKIFSLGHMTIYRNTEKVNLLYQTDLPRSALKGLTSAQMDWETNYRKILSSSTHFMFEEKGINLIAKNVGGGT